MPNERSQIPAATATADPVLDPAGSICGSSGFRHPDPSPMFSSVVTTLAFTTPARRRSSTLADRAG